MAFVTNATQQITLMDSTFNLTEREKRLLENHGQKRLLRRYFQLLMKTFFQLYIAIRLLDLTLR